MSPEKKILNGIAVYEHGDPSGLPVVLTHAFPLDHTMWKPQIDALPPGFRAITYDVRGFGASDVGDAHHTIEGFADDLIGVLDGLGIDRAVLCGLSMGGYIVLRTAQRHPDRLRGLVLCDTRSEADTDEGRIKRAGAIRAVRENGVAKFAEGFVKNVLCEKTLKSDPKVAEFVSAIIRRNDPRGITGALLAMAARTDTGEALLKLKVPALVLVGRDDKLTPPSAAEAMAARLPQARMHVLEDAAHLSNLENPEAFNREFFGFLNALPRS